MLDLTKYAIALDVWQGSGQINESILLANGVEAMFIRMNTSAGQLQYDANFLTQWKEASAFKRVAYVVVSPLNIGHVFKPEEYINWILAFKPTDCKIVALDVEIDAAKLYNNSSITPAYYSNFLISIFNGLHAAGMICMQYSGAWFYNIIQPWVKADWLFQWWARYMNSMYPPIPTDANGNPIYPVITWDAMKTKMAALDWTPLTTGYTESMTGHISVWQITSVYVLPGCQPNDPVDVNLIPRADFNAIFGTPLTLESLDARLIVVEKKLGIVS